MTRYTNTMRNTAAWLIAAATAGSTAWAQNPPEVAGGFRRVKPIDFSDRVVKFNAGDGVIIEADFYPVKVAEGKRTPVAILVHMYPADRSSWKPFVEDLRAAGIAVLAYDIRGQGGSKEPAEMKLAEGYANRNPQHFVNAWMDAGGASTWVTQQRHIDANAQVVIGASIGSSVALQFGAYAGGLRAVVCLSPGTDYMDIPSMQHIKACADMDVPVLLMSPEGEYAAVEKLIEASGGKAIGRKFAGGEENHGTKMFDAKYGAKAKRAIVEFVCEKLKIPVPKPAGKESDASGEKSSKKKDGDDSGKKKSAKSKKKANKDKGKDADDKPRSKNKKKKDKPADDE